MRLPLAAIALTLLSTLSPLTASANPIQDIRQQNKKFMDFIYLKVGNGVTNQVSEEQLINEGMRTCLRLYQGWSTDDIRKDQVERMFVMGLKKTQQDYAISLFASINVAAKEVYCLNFSNQP